MGSGQMFRGQSRQGQQAGDHKLQCDSKVVAYLTGINRRDVSSRPSLAT